MALFTEREDTRPRNPEHRRRIEELYDLNRVQREEENLSDLDAEHSIDDYLDNTDDFRDWARRKVKDTRYDPQNRRPLQISDSTLSDYNIEFTRLNKTMDSITPSSLSSLNIPQASSASLSFTMGTPAMPKRNSRRSSATPRKSTNYTPNLILREKQQAKVDRLTRGRFTKDFSKDFLPKDFSTPVRLERKRTSFIARPKNVDRGERESVVSSSNEDAQDDDENAVTPIQDDSDPTLTDDNKAADNVTTSQVIPETQPNDTIIPETQQNDSNISETQQNGSIIPETQDVPKTQDFVPETQENDIPATQDSVANNPVQAQGTQPNTEQQAESRDKILEELSRKRIQSRPPIHGYSPNVTPSTISIAKQIAKTPSRLPISISRTPKPVHTTALTPHTPVAVQHISRSHVGEVTSSNDQNARAGQMNKYRTPTSQLNQPAAVPSTVIPGPNITVNVNVSNTQPQSPHQTSQPIRKNDQNIENAMNGGNSGGDRRNSSNENLLTDDSDSMGNEANLSDSRCETPKADTRNTSACRRLFAQDEAEQTRRSATFNKIDNLTHTIDNMTRTIPGDKTHSLTNQFRTRSKNSIPNTNAKSPIATNSQTFTKPKTPLQNATYDVSAENLSVRPSISQRAYNGIDSEEFIAQLSSEGTNNGSTFGNMADLPSEALLGSINVSDDEMNVDEANGVDANHQNQNVKKRSRSRSKVTDKRSLSKDSYDLRNSQRQPSVILQRISTDEINRQSNGNVSNVRESLLYNILPPVNFQDGEIINERSPNSQKIVSKVTTKRLSEIQKSFHEPQNESVPPNTRSKRSLKKRTPRPPDEKLTALEKSLGKLKEKQPSENPLPRRLRSVDQLHDDDESVESTETSRANQSTSSINESVFKKPNAPPPRKSKTSKANESNSANNSAPNTEELLEQDELVVTVDVQPLDDDVDDVFEANVQADDNEPSTSNQSNVRRNPSPPQPSPPTHQQSPKRKKNSQAKSPKKPTKKQPSRSKSRAKEPEVTEEPEATASETGGRRSRRERSTDATFLSQRLKFMMASQHQVDKYKSKAHHVAHRTEPVIPIRNDPESEPPRKKARAQSEIGRNVARSSSKSIKSMKIGPQRRISNATAPVIPHENESETELPRKKPRAQSEKGHKIARQSSSKTRKINNLKAKHTDFDPHKIESFTKDFDGFIKDGKQEKLQWWQELLNLEEKGPIVHNINEVDVEYINTTFGQIEISSTDKVAYSELNGVDYGFVPACKRHVGFMRFRPKSEKAKGKSAAELELHVLVGNFIIQYDGGEFEAPACTDVTIPKDGEYGIVNCSDEIGIVQFTYAKM